MRFGTAGTALQCIAGALFLGHATLPWLKIGWYVALSAWISLLVIMLVGLWGMGWLVALALIPFAALVVMLLIRRSVLARYRGDDPGISGLRQGPPTGPCQRCGSPESEYLAPRICISAGIYTYVYNGQVRNLCLNHARIYAVPAAIISLTLGSIGLPFGLFLGPIAAAKNIIEGGDRVSRAEAEQARQRSQLDGDAHGFLMASAIVSGIFFVSGLASLKVLDAIYQLPAARG